jgi:hypothetical protein
MVVPTMLHRILPLLENSAEIPSLRHLSYGGGRMPLSLIEGAIASAVVVREGASVSADEVRDWVRERLRGTRVPAIVKFVTALPHNDTDKVLRRVLREQLAIG